MKIAPGNDKAHDLRFAAACGHLYDHPQPVIRQNMPVETAPEES